MAKRAKLPEKGAKPTRKGASACEKCASYPKKSACIRQTKFSRTGRPNYPTHRPPPGSCFLKMAKRAKLPEKGARLTRKRASHRKKRTSRPKKSACIRQTKFSRSSRPNYPTHRPLTGFCFLKMAKRAKLPEKGARLTRKRASLCEKSSLYPKKSACIRQTKFSRSDRPNYPTHRPLTVFS
jgi:hypothetical protein